MRIYPPQHSSSNSPSGSGENTTSNSSQPSPLSPVSNNLPVPPEMEPLPPAQITNGVTPAGNSTTPPVRAPNTPFHPSSNNAAGGNPPIPTDLPSADSADHAARAVTPRSKFLQTLQSNSAWDALIHGSFSWALLSDVIHPINRWESEGVFVGKGFHFFLLISGSTEDNRDIIPDDLSFSESKR